MPEAILGIGSNSHPETSLRAAHAALAAEFGTVCWSSVYRSRAAGVTAPDYLNAVATIATARDPADLRAALRAMEERCGRRRTDAAVVALDLDLLFYGQRVDAEQRLPRPRAFVEPYVVVPLAELAPGFSHPVDGVTAAAAARWVDAGALARVGRVTDLG